MADKSRVIIRSVSLVFQQINFVVSVLFLTNQRGVYNFVDPLPPRLREPQHIENKSMDLDLEDLSFWEGRLNP